MALKEQKGSPWGEAGQVLLIVVLVVIVASTIGLSLASRSITSLRTSTEEAESQKALAAAEAGIERTMQVLVPVGVQETNQGNNAAYATEVSEVDGLTFLMNGGALIPKDEGADLWLSTYSSDPASNFGAPLWEGDLTVYWGESATACENPAIEIIIISGLKSDPESKKYVYDPCPERQTENHFSAPSDVVETITGKTFLHGATISGVSSGLIARIIPIYGNASVGIKGDSSLPLQGYKIDSTGTAGQANRKITVFKGYPQTYLPFLSYGLFVAAD